MGDVWKRDRMVYSTGGVIQAVISLQYFGSAPILGVVCFHGSYTGIEVRTGRFDASK